MPHRPTRPHLTVGLTARRSAAALVAAAAAAGGVVVTPSLSPAWAAEITWTGGNGAWGDPAEWSSGAVPTADDDAVFDDAGTARVDVPADAVAGSLVLLGTSAFPGTEVILRPVPIDPTSGALHVGESLAVGGNAVSAPSTAMLELRGVAATVGGDVTIGGTTSDHAQGWLTVDGANALLDAAGGVRVRAGGMLLLEAGGTVRGPVLVETTGRVSGAGTVDGDVTVADAYVQPDAGTLAVTGDLLMTETSAPGDDSFTAGVSLTALGADTVSTLSVAGDFAPAGLLRLNKAGTYAPTAGDSFDLLDFDPLRLTGTFERLALPALAGDLAWDASDLYTTGEVRVVPEPASALAAAALLVAGLAGRHRRRTPARASG